jgi:CubicO group peptidase (beta-lactamase class C family)
MMQRTWMMLLTIVLAALQGADPSPKTIDAFFAAAMKPGSPGCQVGIVRAGEFVYKNAYGLADIEHSVPMTTHSPIIIASGAKQFTAAVVAHLARVGQLSLDDSLRKYVPELPTYADEITISHLIHHTSGLRDYPTLLSMGGQPEALSERQFVRLMARQEGLNYPPGTSFLYSNSNYAMLSIMVRKITGKSLRAYADEVLFQPLGMHNTHFHDNRAEPVPGRVIPYVPVGQSFRVDGDTADNLLAPGAPALVGDGNLYTAADDLVGWARYLEGSAGKELAVAGKLADGTPIDYAFGLVNVRLSGSPPFLAHGGNNGAYRAAIAHYPEQKLTIGVFCNHAGMDPQQIGVDIAALFLPPVAVHPGSAPPAQNGVQPTAPPAAEITDIGAYAGRYFSREVDGAHEIAAVNGVLRLISRTVEAELRASDKDRFTWSSWTFSFERDGSGHVSGYRLDGTRAKGVKYARVE